MVLEHPVTTITNPNTEHGPESAQPSQYRYDHIYKLQLNVIT
jgi:hypothetical protein